MNNDFIDNDSVKIDMHIKIFNEDQIIVVLIAFERQELHA